MPDWDINGTVVSQEEAAEGLGFKSGEEMIRFYELIKPMEEPIEKALNRCYGKSNKQIVFEIASLCATTVIQGERNDQATLGQPDAGPTGTPDAG